MLALSLFRDHGLGIFSSRVASQEQAGPWLVGNSTVHYFFVYSSITIIITILFQLLTYFYLYLQVSLPLLPNSLPCYLGLEKVMEQLPGVWLLAKFKPQHLGDSPMLFVAAVN